MALWLRVSTAPEDSQSSVPSTHATRLTTICVLVPGDLTPFSDSDGHELTDYIPHRHTCIIKNKIKCIKQKITKNYKIIKFLLSSYRTMTRYPEMFIIIIPVVC